LKSIAEGTMEIFAATGSGAEFPAETEAQPEKMTEKMTTQARSMNRESGNCLDASLRK
jgi:hypothetical protein